MLGRDHLLGTLRDITFFRNLLSNVVRIKETTSSSGMEIEVAFGALSWLSNKPATKVSNIRSGHYVTVTPTLCIIRTYSTYTVAIMSP